MKQISYIFLILVGVFVFVLPEEIYFQGLETYQKQFQLISKLIYLKIYALIILCLIGFGVWFDFFKYLFSVIKIPLERKLFLPLLFLLTLLLVLANWFPIMLDEANSYLFFVEKGFLVTASYYPSPNNHVFSNLIGGLIHLLGVDSAFSLRLVSILSMVFTGYFLFLFLIEFFSSRVAGLSVFLWLCFYHSIIYGFLGRGYSLEVLLFILSILSLVKWHRTSMKSYLYWYVIFSVLGFYTVPTFMFYFLPASLFWVLEAKQVRLWSLCNTTIFIGAFLLYFPILVFSGFDSIIGNSWVQASGSFYLTFLSRIHDFFTFQWLYSGGVYLSLILVALYFKVGKNQSSVFRIFILSYGVLLLISLVLQRFPPFRVLHFFTFLNFLIIALLLEPILVKSKILLLLLPLSMISWSLFTIHNFRNNGMTQYDDLNNVNVLVRRTYKIDKLSVDNDFYFVMLKYHLGDNLKVNYTKECKGYFLSIEKQKDPLGETEFTSLGYCK